MDKKIGTPYDYRQLREIINANHDRFSELNYDTSLSFPQKMNSLVEWFKVLLQEYDEWIKYLDEFQDKFDENLYNTVYDIIAKWLTDGVITEVVLGLSKILEIFPARDWEKNLSWLDTRYSYHDAYRYGFKDDYIDDLCNCTDNSLVFDEFINACPSKYRLNFRADGTKTYHFTKVMTINKQLTIEGIAPDTVLFYFTNLENNNGISITSRYVTIKNLNIKGLGKALGGTGLNFWGSAPNYNAYGQFENIIIDDFRLGFFTGDSFYVTTRWMIIRGCNQPYLANNCATTLTVEKVYVLNCDNGFQFIKVNYSSLIDTACDNVVNMAYSFRECRTISLNGVGCEQVGSTAYYISDSTGIVLNGATALGTNNGSTFSSVFAIVRSSVTANGLVEQDNKTTTGYSGTIDATSTLTCSNLVLLNDFYPPAGAKVYGTATVKGVFKKFEGNIAIYYLDTPDKKDYYKVGDIIERSNITPSTPIKKWVCVGNTSANTDWRILESVLFNHPTKTTLPSVSGSLYLGLQATLDGNALVLFNGVDWKKVNLVGIDS